MTVTTYYYPSEYGSGAPADSPNDFSGTPNYTGQFQAASGTYTKLVVDSSDPTRYLVTFGYGGANPITEYVYQTQYSDTNINETTDGTYNYILTNGPVGPTQSFTIPSTGSTTNPAFVPNSAFENDPTLCFAEGTLIRTVRGDVAIERLAVGDRVITASGAARPIIWLGHRAMDLRHHPAPETALPVRIAAHAFGPDRPARDLVVSPGHAICVDILGEVFIPAAALVNGASVAQIATESVTYWHVELDSHDVLLAENLPAESYFDMGNRHFFTEANVVAFGAATPDAPVPTHADFCRPYMAVGPVVDIVRTRLRERAVTAGWRLAEGGIDDMHLLVDGVVVRPDVEGLAARFVVPTDAENVWLVSATGVPSQLGVSPDDRRLGLCLRGLTIDDGLTPRRVIAPDDARLVVGFHGCEDGTHRWSAGRARLPATLWEGCRGHVFLRLDLASMPLPRWVEPNNADTWVAEPMREAS